MDNWHTFGHGAAKSVLNKQLETKIFPHAYLFYGPDGIGKKTLALELAGRILNAEKPENHPDFQILDMEGEITAEPMQNFMRTLSFKPFSGEKKVAIINNAQNLNKTSGNALLKTLEEPSPSTIIILIVNGAGVLPTIASRCQIFNFSLFGLTALTDFARSKKMEAEDGWLALAFGSSSRLERLCRDKAYLESELEVKKAFDGFKKDSLGERFLKIGELAEKEPADLKNNLVSWMFLAAAGLKERPQDFTKVKALMEAAQNLDKNFNKKMVLQGLMQKI